MSTSANEARSARAVGVKATKAVLAVDLDDGRTVMVPIGWYPRLLHGTPQERNHWRLIAGGEGIHWPDLDEDISVEGLLAGHPSGESQSSLKRWLAARREEQPNKRMQRTRAASQSQRTKRVPHGGPHR